MIETITRMIGTLAVIVVCSVVVSNADVTNRFITSNKRWIATLSTGVMGGLLGVYGNYSGVEMSGALVSVRDMGPMMAGITGGPMGGLLAGLIAGMHRLSLGGPTRYACLVGTLCIGLLCGLLLQTFKKNVFRPWWGFLIGMLMELGHLSLVMVFVRPLSQAEYIVKSVGVPFVTMNAIGFAVMLGIIGYIDRQKTERKEQHRIESELSVAEKIQSSMLPVILPTFPGRREFSIEARMEPAKVVGGDFYDIFYIDKDHLVLVMADVAGKGIPAALFMAISKALIQNNITAGLTPAEAVTMTNKQLCEHNDAEMFVTAWIGVLEISSGRITYVNAGHNPPVLARNGSFEYLKMKSGFVLAGFEKTVYHHQEFIIDDGDMMLLYTDGVTESENNSHELYGEERLLSFIKENTLGKEPAGLVKELRTDLRNFADGHEQSDDITMMCIKFNGRYEDREYSPEISEIERVTAAADAFMKEKNIPDKIIRNFDICIDEIFSNIVKFSGSDKVTVGVSVNYNRISMRFIDSGVQYDPRDAEMPDVHQKAEDRQIGGLGLMMVENLMDVFDYEYRNGRNITVIRKFN